MSSPGDGGEKRMEKSVSFPSSCDFFGQTRRSAILRISRVFSRLSTPSTSTSRAFFARFRVSRLATPIAPTRARSPWRGLQARHSWRRRAWRDRLEYQRRRAGSRGDSARAATAHEGVARGRHLCFREKELRQEGSRPRWQASSGRASPPFGEFPRRAPRSSRRPRCTDPSPPRGSGLGPGRPRRTSSGGGARRLARVAREAAR